jgi:hypothetical protein
MEQSFDDFARKHVSDGHGRTRLTQETAAEWEVLKGLVSQFSLDKRVFGNQIFEWSNTLVGQSMLSLGNVAAVLKDDGLIGGVPKNTRVEFTRRPIRALDSALESYAVDDDSPVEDINWGMELEIDNGELVWRSTALSEPCSASDFAERIATMLAQYHVAYERAYGREA